MTCAGSSRGCSSSRWSSPRTTSSASCRRPIAQLDRAERSGAAAAAQPMPRSPGSAACSQARRRGGGGPAAVRPHSRAAARGRHRRAENGNQTGPDERLRGCAHHQAGELDSRARHQAGGQRHPHRADGRRRDHPVPHRRRASDRAEAAEARAAGPDFAAQDPEPPRHRRKAAAAGRPHQRAAWTRKPIDFRVSTVPGKWGEKVCMRILDKSNTTLGLDKLINHAADSRNWCGR